jgi:hypothetical protein
MVRVIDPGHRYGLEPVGYGHTGTTMQELLFVKNEGAKYPGNVGFHGGVLTQEVLRALIDRTKYLNAQGSCMETEMALAAMQQALAWYEVRAARCRGTHIEGEHIDALDKAPVCRICGHNQCRRDVHERLPGTRR